MVSIYEQLEDSLIDSFEEALPERYAGTPIIFSHGMGLEPKDTYIVLDIINMVQIGRTQTSTRASPKQEVDEEQIDYELTSKGDYEVTVQVSAIGKKAGAIATDLHHLINTTPVWEKFQLNELYPIRKTDVRRSPVLRDTRWVERMNMDVTFTYSVYTKQDIDVIEKVGFKYEIIN